MFLGLSVCLCDLFVCLSTILLKSYERIFMKILKGWGVDELIRFR